MNPKLWIKALRVIPRISKEEWDTLDVVSKWLSMTRFAVIFMTFAAAVVAGIFAFQAGRFNLFRWICVVVGLVFAHAANNIANDMTDYKRGVDVDNYYRTMYGPQPLQQGLMTKREVLKYLFVTLFIAGIASVPLMLYNGLPIILLTLSGVAFIFLYTWPLKYIGLGELVVFIIWGPLMIAGGYSAITGLPWDWNVAIASIPYGLGPTCVIFGKHIDKRLADKYKKIHTLPVIIGETASRNIILIMLALMYFFIIYQVVTGFYTIGMLVVLISLKIFADR